MRFALTIGAESDRTLDHIGGVGINVKTAVRFAPGEYEIDAPIVLEGQGLVAPGVTLRPSASFVGSRLVHLGGLGSFVEGVTLDATGGPAELHGIRVGEDALRPVIRGVTIMGASLDGVYVAKFGDTLANTPTDVLMEDVTIRDCARSCFSIVGANGITLRNIISVGSGINGVNFEHGPYTNVLIDGFAVSGAVRHGFSFNPTEGIQGDYITVRNGTIDSCGSVADVDAGLRFRYTGAGCSVANVAMTNMFNPIKASVSLSGEVTLTNVTLDGM